MPKNLTFNADFANRVVEIPISNDLIVEHSEVINLTLVSTDPAVILNPSTSTITIEDVDSKLLYVDHYTHASRSEFIHIYHFSGHNWIQHTSLFCE